MSYYMTMIDKIYRQDHFEVIAIIDLDDVMILKASMLGLAFQQLACIPILDSQLYWTLYNSKVLKKNCW